MWKQMNLPYPAKDFCEYDADDRILLDSQNLVGLLASSAEVLTKEHPLWSEIKIFQNIQAKYKRILHCDKCLQLLQRVGIYLRKMVLLNLSKSYLDLAEPFIKELQSKNPTRHLPSRQQLEYVLIRTQSAAKLICEALHYSRETFCYLIQRLKVGHLILSLMMATSVAARLNILFKGLLVQLNDSYHNIYKWHEKLKVGSFEWALPLDLPEDLDKWLKLEGHLTQSKQLPTKELTFLKYIFEREKNLSKNGTREVNIEDEDDECMIIADTSQPSENLDVEDTNQENENMDIGEVVSRDEEIADVTSTTQEDVSLLQRIEKAKNRKHLFSIWENIEELNTERAVQLTSTKKDKINKMFEDFRQEINVIKSERLTDEERKKQRKQVLKKYKTKFSKLLKFASKQSPVDSEKSKPVKCLSELVELYKNIYAGLQSTKNVSKCKKLHKMFKSRKSDIKLLIQNGEKKLARQLIVCTSKILLTKYNL